ncbi:response regulator receiver domain [Methylobacterium sp. C33D]
MTAGMSLDQLVRDGAAKFLQTVLVIDNELAMEDPPRETVAPRLGNQRPRPFSRASATGAGSADADPDAVPATAEGTAQEAGAGRMPETGKSAEPEPNASTLNVKTIMDAFLRRSLICGMHRPEKRDDLVQEAINAARRSDAVIVDWLLMGSDPTPAKDIIAGILKGDKEDHGRLRLIVVYTSMAGVGGISKEILEHMAEAGLVDRGGGVLTGPDTRIVVLNKAGTPLATETVAVDALPERIIDEFARLSNGILSTFAVTAVAGIRRATHHVLAVFSSELDGAFLAHRCALKTPDDATDFALELLAGEFKGVVTRAGEATRVLAAGPLEEWIARKAGTDGNIRTDAVEIPAEIVKTFARDGEKAITSTENLQKHAVAPGQPQPKGGLGQKKIGIRTVGLLFHENTEHYLRAHHGFARLSQFKNEPYGRRAPRDDWRPTLSLGSVIVKLDAQNNPIRDHYLLCTQPRCDAVRIEKTRRFPFQMGRLATPQAFNLVASEPGTADGEEPIYVIIEMKPHDTVMVEFEAKIDQRVMAEAVGNSFHFVACDKPATRYLWLGDLRDLTAQRTAGAVASRLHEVGIDEFEWLRLHAKEKPPKAEKSEPGQDGNPAGT